MGIQAELCTESSNELVQDRCPLSLATDTTPIEFCCYSELTVCEPLYIYIYGQSLHGDTSVNPVIVCYQNKR